jgi:histidinol-phosphate/aromatic aminotransferase/cobyric acid decarboxylase-like protein
LLRRGLVPRTFGAGHPLADHLRVTIRDAAENDKLLAAARELADVSGRKPARDVR